VKRRGVVGTRRWDVYETGPRGERVEAAPDARKGLQIHFPLWSEQRGSQAGGFGWREGRDALVYDLKDMALARQYTTSASGVAMEALVAPRGGSPNS